MIVSNRQRRILEVLLQRKEATANEIAEEVQISARTVHRDISEMKGLLSDYGLFLATKSGKGIAIQGSEDNLVQFHKVLAHFETVTYAPEERKTLILCRLLEAFEPIKLFSLAYEMRAAIPTISRDLDEIDPQLSKYKLELIRKRGYGVEIKGMEGAKRALIEWLVREYLDESDLFDPGPISSNPWTVSRRLLHMVGKDHFLPIERMLWELEEKWPRRLTETAYMRLLLKLSIAVARMRCGHWLSNRKSGKQGNEAAGDTTDLPPPHLQPFLDAFPWEWPAAELEAMQSLFVHAMAEAVKQEENLLHQNGAAAADAADRLIQTIGKKLNMPFDEDQSLLEGLVNHLAPAMDRLSRGEAIRNPLLAQIRKDFAVLFNAIRGAIDELPFAKLVPDEEIGYLAMHFGASMERLNQLKRVRAIIVCTSGIGSSKLLAARIAKQFPRIELIGNYSWYEASRIPQTQYDLIVSTVDLPIDAGRYVKISPLLTGEETEKLRAFMGSLSIDEAAWSEEGKREDAGGWERMKQMNAYTSAIIQVLEPFAVHQLLASSGPLSDVVSSLLAPLASELEPKGTAAVAKLLLEREQASSQAIAGTQLALFHTRSDHISKPILKLYRLEEPLWLGEGGDNEVRRILLMLAPLQLSRPVLEILSEISVLLLQPEFEALLEDAEADAIKLYVSQQLEAYIQSKWRGRDLT
ncbi:BglG family transcription antiterminator [Paenibacillus gorillae]|uniref:BglG family transcription antiterminator n=1 Tax=Paenibacillus gorillae TaxID=1243662 RepID=UPI0004B041EB|nr:BglG family transcription antiterminator [Paenibacillus gorillae]